MSVGSLVAFITYLALIMSAVMMATMVSMMAPRAAVSAERIQEVLDTFSSVTPPRVPVTEVAERGRLELRDVGFRYPGAEHAVLQHISFTSLPGQTTAIIGSTGSGKTSLINVAARLFDVTSGTVLFDGVDIRELDPDILWQRIGIVPQKPYLFAGTVASNLRYGKPDATDDELWTALEVAQAADFVRAMPGGLDAEISQGGVNVSGGQRQRLAMARALVRKPEIYLFDDSFSALDLATDARLRAALVPYASDATVIIVAQRCLHDHVRRPDPRARRRRGGRAGNARTTAQDVSDLRRDRGVADRARGCRHERSSNKTADGVKPPPPGGQPGTRFGSFGMPAEKPKDFGSTTRRLLRRLQRERWAVIVAIVMTVVSVCMSVLLPKVLGSATDVVVQSRVQGQRDRLRSPGPHTRLRLRAARGFMGAAVRDVVHPRRRRPANDVPTAGRRRGQAQPVCRSATSTGRSAATCSAA